MQVSTKVLVKKADRLFPKERLDKESELKIIQFKYKNKIHTNYWNLEIQNQSRVNFIKVEIFILEDNIKIAQFNLIESMTDFKKKINLAYSDDIYGKHLMAKIAGKPISELYPIMKIEFLAFRFLESADSYMITIKNMSQSSLNNLTVYCDQTKIEYVINKELKSGRSVDFGVNFQPNIETIFLRVI